MSANVSPSEEELKPALFDLRNENPTLGIPKLHALLLSRHPSWTVSEKRTRKILQAAGLVLGPPPEKHAENSQIFPSSKLVKKLDVSRWTPKVEVKYFGKKKGKGLIAKEVISQGEMVWKEDPFVVAPECLEYSTLIQGDIRPSKRPLAPALTARHPSPSLHLSLNVHRSPVHLPHRAPPVSNPASIPLLSFARRASWMALHALARCTARLLLATQDTDASTLEEDWGVVSALAELGMEERAKGAWFGGVEPDRATWKKAHQLFVQAFQSPTSSPDQKKLARLLKKPIPAEIVQNIFPYDAFLRGLGRMSLNLEAHGGLYTLHSHLNHSCDPNISARHLDQRTALSRLTLLARRDINAGEELCVAYVDPSLGVKQRREQLGAWGFGVCQCERCIREEKEEGGKDVEHANEAVHAIRCVYVHSSSIYRLRKGELGFDEMDGWLIDYI
ncbi:hypothetical protein EW146_g6893 [Bondarzewia mesenterica]|uniref:Histone-lysine N-methyltransferase SET5 n=1 Tax=Bondarzewia mesenterica TaxID=1095465 RepID=A0A4S4LMZ2_9AGAM|nr:hypothetical protein EW146_g6893 [Bondarzewia mesenterica]